MIGKHEAGVSKWVKDPSARRPLGAAPRAAAPSPPAPAPSPPRTADPTSSVGGVVSSSVWAGVSSIEGPPSGLVAPLSALGGGASGGKSSLSWACPLTRGSAVASICASALAACSRIRSIFSLTCWERALAKRSQSVGSAASSAARSTALSAVDGSLWAMASDRSAGVRVIAASRTQLPTSPRLSDS